jgi:uncharacterized protein (TIGR00730 family)
MINNPTTAALLKQMVDVATTFKSLKKNAVVFGSARTHTGEPAYSLARQLGRSLSVLGYNVITGGGPGIMEAANLGASEAGSGKSVGLNLDLPCETYVNDYQDVSLHFTSFLPRKYGFFYDTDVYFVMPGGDGTLDELYEARTLMHTGMMRKAPIVLITKDFWEYLDVWMNECPVRSGTIAPSAMRGMSIVNTIEEALAAGGIL